ncbi:MAG: hypothetical protein GTO53_06590 [Planctomycetales bacterium]|nr:hypothetical protein [Planctomycetales bacterium]NIM08808.1 hypothetical protein [Planctomycetales bacterium]NIN07738.1 hypothetical protein [Planctomycetales bacterium]NIN77396.1 hypothetical protein [Planctomycetales bacterium]NIO34573.1 hypothetical protein [Planctomycetales bacterium]
MSAIILLTGLVLAALLVAAAIKLDQVELRLPVLVGAVIVLMVSFVLASFRFVSEDSIGVVTKNVGFVSLPPGKIIATEGEKGPQARILPPGWHPWYWPFIYDLEYYPITEIPSGSIGLLNASDGKPLPPDTTYAPEWEEGALRKMAQDARYFLTEGGGYKGPQTSVLKPGSYRINPRLFQLEIVPVTTIEKATVGVVKSNVGPRPKRKEGDEAKDPGARRLVKQGERGIWSTALLEGQYYLNTKAFEITKVSTRKHIVRYTAGQAQRAGGTEEREIMVRTSDGFTFPVDVRVEYEIRPSDAPILVATVGDDQEGLRTVMNSVVRAIFRNNAEGVKALNYVQQRSSQESQSLQMLRDELQPLGVSVTGVRIGDVGDEQTLGTLLKTQTDREIALQEQETFKEQQRAAEQQKELSKTQQEAEEEKRLATASYSVQIAEREKEKRIIEATAEAEAVRIRAEAQAQAFQKIAQQIGPGNTALIEVLKTVGEQQIPITPRVMVVGEGAGAADAQTTALIGTMLDSMIDKKPQSK